MPIVRNFQGVKDRAPGGGGEKARPQPKGALDSIESVAFFAEWLLLGTTDQEIAKKDDPGQYDIRNASLYPNGFLPRT